MITIVCIYNSIEQLSTMLLPSLGIKSCCHSGAGLIMCRSGNLLLIDNRDGDYKSAAEAFNRELAIHQTELNDILIFCHQDIVFDGDDFLNDITSHLSKKRNQILGVAGMSKGGHTISNLKYYKTREYITLTQLDRDMIVESLDECCFAVHKEIFFKLLFNERICRHWHLYAVELCYRARLKLKTDIIVLPSADVFHKMDGAGGLYTDSHFLSCMTKLAWTYRRHCSAIYAPCYIVSTDPLKMIMKIWKTRIGNILKKRR